LLRYWPHESLRDPRRYLFKVASRVAKADNRKAQIDRQRLTTCEPTQLEVLAQDQSSLWVLENGGIEITVADFEGVCQELPEKCRAAFLRHRRDGWTYQQIANELGITKNAVKDCIVRVLDHLRSHFFDESQRPQRRAKDLP
jgi:RNA polymerase sigma-70 factor (ECF subfamily)